MSGSAAAPHEHACAYCLPGPCTGGCDVCPNCANRRAPTLAENLDFIANVMSKTQPPAAAPRKRRTAKDDLTTYTGTLYVVVQEMPWERRYCVDPNTGIPYLYTKDQCDPGQLEFGMERYVAVRVTITPRLKKGASK